MPTCPKCGQDYYHLKAFCLEENRYELSLGADDKLEGKTIPTLEWSSYDRVPVESSCVKIEVECPNCEAVIYSNKGDSEDPELLKLLGVNPTFGG